MAGNNRKNKSSNSKKSNRASDRKVDDIPSDNSLGGRLKRRRKAIERGNPAKANKKFRKSK